MSNTHETLSPLCPYKDGAEAIAFRLPSMDGNEYCTHDISRISAANLARVGLGSALASRAVCESSAVNLSHVTESLALCAHVAH